MGTLRKHATQTDSYTTTVEQTVRMVVYECDHCGETFAQEEDLTPDLEDRFHEHLKRNHPEVM